MAFSSNHFRSPRMWFALAAVAFLLFVSVPWGRPTEITRTSFGMPKSWYENKIAWRTRAAIEQNAFCRTAAVTPLPDKTVEKTIDLDGVSYKLTLYDTGMDAVSAIIIRTGVWEHAATRQVLWALKLANDVRGQDRATFLDIGGNVGWYTVTAAAHGHRVAVFEPMPQNEYLIRRSLCANRDLARHVDYYAMGLGAQPDECRIISHNENHGNGILQCGEDSKKPVADQHGVRADVSIHTLDGIVQDDRRAGEFGVMKMDVEGFESEVLKGGEKSLFATDNRPPMIMMEYIPSLQARLLGDDPTGILTLLDGYGYEIRTSWFTHEAKAKDSTETGKVYNSFLGEPAVRPSEFKAWSDTHPTVDIFLVHRSFVKEAKTWISARY
ncbi:FkbM family methyltransferase [Spizellomyces punctatus DAOM BR117]|uniref:FkbM family methyltransferase n=1 Tax=Spizellomyces punctatus (strain DAOM BR117) TaxID=645134 RepID=A0A0L0H555_SPIPD|nr:FkbM family methyltransferase [Spizellomyces punctatus DAOM BR117]KNC96625.1 FkbM family methyltransferase [Spizellomyces punctatus DAOM BR117]|eukprot:XP_016604665.1 FkbM family methyltransferase [Spizellomyces punctatus DAOM BR117]